MFSEKLQRLIRFVPALDVELQDNPRNDAMKHFAALRDGTAARTELVYPRSNEFPRPADQENGQQEPPKPPPAAVVAPCANALGADASDASNDLTQADHELLNGAELEVTEVPPVPPMPTSRATASRGGASSGTGTTKRDALKEKKKAAQLARASGNKKPASGNKKPAPPKRNEKDSSDDDDSSEEEADDSSDDSSDEGRAKPPARKQSKPVLKQAKLSPKVSLCEIATDAPEVSALAVGPSLDAKNAGSRFVFVPAEQFQAEGIGGWVAKILSVMRDNQQTTTLQFKDAAGKCSREYFKFAHVVEHFKPLS